MKHGTLYRIAFEGFGLCVCLILLLSIFSFDMGDAPSRYVYPNNDPAANLCGSAGAICAYYLLYYFGPGVIAGLIAAAVMLGIHLFKPVDHAWLRIVGLALVVMSLSGMWGLVWPDGSSQSMIYRGLFSWLYASGDFPEGGNGGILGGFIAEFLSGHLALLGTWLVLVSSWIVGSILLADTLVFAIVRGFGTGVLKMLGLAEPAWNVAKEQSQVLGDIWTRLSEKQKAQAEPKKTFRQSVREYTAEHPVKTEAYATASAPAETVHTTLEPEHDEAVEAAVAGTEPQEKEKKRIFKRKKPKPAARPKQAAPVQKTYDDYQLPPLDFLKEPEVGFSAIQSKMVEHKAEALEGLLEEFGVNAQVVNAEAGPAITMYELELAAGVKVNQISNLSNDMARALGSGTVRVVAPLAGKHTIGIEVPNSQRETVRLKELLQKAGGPASKMSIPLFLGKSSSGEVLISDLAAMPHCLIAGTTGSGKSVCINTIITSIMLTRRPDEVKLILIDPKMVEMAMFESIPHLMCPTITEMRRAEQILEWATQKMDERYELLAEAQVRNIASYNLLTQEELLERFKPTTPEEEAKIPKKLPHIVIIIDELADLMMTSAKEIEAYIVRIAQKSRAVGIHLVLATQRPQATVVTGLIKSNMPSRIAFRVAARMDSRIILDQNGAETLLGQGDMLFLKPGTSELVRSQGAFLDDDEIRGVVKFLKEVAEPQFSQELMQLNRVDLSMAKKDDMFDEAVRIVLESGRGSVSLLQRRLSIGYARASRIIEMMAGTGLLGEYKGSQAREVTMTLEEYDAMKKSMIEDEVAGYADLTQDSGEEGEEEYQETSEYIDQEEYERIRDEEEDEDDK